MQDSSAEILRAMWGKVYQLWHFHLRIALTLPLLMLPWVCRNRWLLFALATCAVVVAGVFTETFLNPHYIAPIECLLIAAVVTCARRLYLLGSQRGRFLVGCLTCICVGSFAIGVAEHVASRPQDASVVRAEMLGDLERQGGRHLVLVNFRPGHPSAFDWVFNQADIDNAPVVWARAMNAVENRELLDYFPDRQVWLLNANVQQPQLIRWNRNLARAE